MCTSALEFYTSSLRFENSLHFAQSCNKSDLTFNDVTVLILGAVGNQGTNYTQIRDRFDFVKTHLNFNKHKIFHELQQSAAAQKEVLFLKTK